MNIQVGSKLINYKFKGIEARRGKEVIVFGREFHQKFSRTVFDWDQQRVALGDKWFDTIVDINPDLPDERQDQLKELLKEFSNRFAKDTKKPTLTNVGEHIIETTPRARHVKCKMYRLSTEQEEGVKWQANKMVEDGVAQP